MRQKSESKLCLNGEENQRNLSREQLKMSASVWVTKRHRLREYKEELRHAFVFAQLFCVHLRRDIENNFFFVLFPCEHDHFLASLLPLE